MSERARRRGTRRLDAKILATYRQACREGKRDVAEPLMRALETLAELPDDSLPLFPCACLDEAYLFVADGFHSEAPNVRADPSLPRPTDKH